MDTLSSDRKYDIFKFKILKFKHSKFGFSTATFCVFQNRVNNTCASDHRHVFRNLYITTADLLFTFALLQTYTVHASSNLSYFPSELPSLLLIDCPGSHEIGD